MTAYNSLHTLPDYECLLFCRNCLDSDLRIGHFFSFRCSLVSTPQLNTELLTNELRLPYGWTTTESFWVWVLCYDRRSVGQCVWNKAPIWSLRPDFYYCQTVAGLLIWGALSLWREDGSVVYNCCLPSPAQSFSCLRFESSLFTASYDSQSYGVGIQPRLHAGYPESFFSARLLI
jgi:hypothetical protein